MTLPLHPIDARQVRDRRRSDQRCWYYQEECGLEIVVVPTERFTSYIIPLKEIRAYLARVDAEKKR